jgi:hypothetical protein
MTEKEVQEIYNRLLELTKAGAIQWKKTGESEFTTNLSRSSITVGRGLDILDSPIVLQIFNDSGLMVALASTDEDAGSIMGGADVKEFNLDPAELFDLVREKVYKYSETTENILSDLRKLKAS